MTSEHVYQTEKFTDQEIRKQIKEAPSAHDAFKIARASAQYIRRDWLTQKLAVMEEILRAKLAQHEYIRQKLSETGDREIIEDSWRDSFWGWGPEKDGQNHLGKLWMKLRDEHISHG